MLALPTIARTPGRNDCLEIGAASTGATADYAEVPGAGGHRWGNTVDLLKSGFSTGYLVVLAGSGVSAAPPAGVPIAGPASIELTRRLTELLGPAFVDRSRETIRTVPFEILMGRLAEIGRPWAEAVVTELASIAGPTRAHEQIAELFRIAELHGRRFNVITPNYDLGIDLAAEERCELAPRSVIRSRQATTDRTIFHVHGAVGAPGSYVLDFRGEFSLERWKRRLIGRLVDGATVAIIGFSGADLDVAEALSDGAVRHVVWFRGTREECQSATWPVAMQALAAGVAGRGGTMVAVATNGHWGEALEPLTFAVADHEVLQDGTRIAERYERIVPRGSSRGVLDPDLVHLWARWTALRAGHGDLGTGLSAGERRQLRPRQWTEIKSFHSYYLGRYRTAALLQASAARLALADGSLELFAYHRNLQAEYLNRGAYTPRVAVLVVATLVEAECRLVLSRRRPSRVLLGELVGLVSTLVLMWPFAATFALSAELATAMRIGGRAAAKALERNSFQKATIIEMIASGPGSRLFKRAFERYVWHGQNARLINLRRLLALQSLDAWRRHGDVGQLAMAADSAICAARWASSVSDPVRDAKCRLVLIEVAAAITRLGTDLDGNVWAERRREIAALLPSASPYPELAVAAWRQLEAAEIWTFAYTISRRIYEAGGTAGTHRGLRVRLLGIASLESQ